MLGAMLKNLYANWIAVYNTYDRMRGISVYKIDVREVYRRADKCKKKKREMRL